MPENKGRIVDLFLIHTEDHYAFDLATLPAPFPDWEYRVYADKMGKAHKDHGVDLSIGAMALVRPDGYVSLITGLDGGVAITEFMDKFMLAPESACQSEPSNGTGTGVINGNSMTNGGGVANGNGIMEGNGAANGDGHVI